jgi:ketosteroid isomerase-like protein
MNVVRKNAPTDDRSVAEVNAEGTAALRALWSALVDRRPEVVEKVLAPEFQVMREDGSSDDKRDYVATGVPHVTAIPEISGLVATGHGDVMVTRYIARVRETRDGKVVEKTAPRLTVFRKEGGKWLAVAHGNFAELRG